MVLKVDDRTNPDLPKGTNVRASGDSDQPDASVSTFNETPAANAV